MKWAFGALCLILLPASGSAAPHTSQDAMRAQLYKLFDRLGHDQELKKPFVEVRRWENSPQNMTSCHGFLQSGSGKNFIVLTLGLDIVAVRNGLDGDDQLEETSYRPVDFQEWLKEQKVLWQKEMDEPQNRYAGEDNLNTGSKAKKAEDLRCTPNSDLIILSRVAALNGYPDLSNWFYGVAKAGSPGGLQHEFRRSLATHLFETASSQFGNPEISRSKLLTELKVVRDQFPNSKESLRAALFVKILAPMVAEDKARKPLTDAQIAALPIEKQAEELVWQLRNQTGQQNMNPGEVLVRHAWTTTDTSGTERTPADRLVKLGLPAVPALIAALQDTRVTRTSQGWSRREPLQIRDAAAQVLEGIAGRRLRADRNPEIDDNPETLSATAKNVDAWWKRVQNNGFEKVLAEDVAKGDSDSSDEAVRLLRDYPSAAVAPLKEGISRASEEYIKTNLIGELGSLHTADVISYCRELMLHGISLAVRLTAAVTVARTARKEATDAMIGEWNRLVVTKDNENWLADFLLNSGDIDAIKTVTRDLHSRPIKTRLEIIESCGLTAGDVRIAKVIEDSIAGELTDKDRVYGMSISTGKWELSNVRASDLASLRLAELWPQKYQFRSDRPDKQMDQLNLNNENIWRKSRGLAPLP